jgi:hypothetical protein
MNLEWTQITQLTCSDYIIAFWLVLVNNSTNTIV